MRTVRSRRLETLGILGDISFDKNDEGWGVTFSVQEGDKRWEKRIPLDRDEWPDASHGSLRPRSEP